MEMRCLQRIRNASVKARCLYLSALDVGVDLDSHFVLGVLAHTIRHATPIDSSSVWQARQPIYATSVERWRNYLPFVPELERFAQTAQ